MRYPRIELYLVAVLLICILVAPIIANQQMVLYGVAFVAFVGALFVNLRRGTIKRVFRNRRTL